MRRQVPTGSPRDTDLRALFDWQLVAAVVMAVYLFVPLVAT